jgi:hypothetical protein
VIALVLALALLPATALVGEWRAVAEPKPGSSDIQNAPVAVEVRRIEAFDRGSPGKQKFGKLEFRGGLSVSSPTASFGGWSGLEVDPDGRRFVSVSDAGAWLTGELTYEGQRLSGMRNTRIGPILAVGGKRLQLERDRDAEAIRLLDGTLAKGTVLVGFEQNHRIGVFAMSDKGLGAPSSYLKRSADWGRMIRNKGIEAVTVLRGGPSRGAIVAFAERLPDSNANVTGWIWPAGVADEPQRLLIRRIGDFDLTDVASLADGSLIVLERSFAWLAGVKMRLRLIAAKDVRGGARLDGEVLLEADMGTEIDNMEGLAVHQGARGEAVLTIVSDNNFNGFLQRNLLLQFALPAGRITAAGR